MRVLNVAEKNSAAKNIAALLSNGNARVRSGISKFNKIYEFQYSLFNETCEMRMTSVSGHLLNHSFSPPFNGWTNCHPSSLFDAPVKKVTIDESAIKIKNTLEREVKQCSVLIIWTDCDREGENIGFEIINVCKAVKPGIRIYRAKFSEITKSTVKGSIQNLIQPNKATSDAVEIRSELDLRIGASFTRFQTMFLQKTFPEVIGKLVVSYGSCQLPTLGFIVDRYLEIESFVTEPYWKLKVQDKRDNLCADFAWARDRLFEKPPCQALLDDCLSKPEAKVENKQNKPKSKWRPLPLDTVELQKQCARKLKLTGKQTMASAEKLYTEGFVSYPRTETNIFPKSMDLMTHVSQQTADNRWGSFAQGLVTNGVNPRQGKKTDEAHPPIHPTNYTNTLQGNEAKVYEYIVRHFLACLSADAEGWETIVEIDLAGEKFTAKGLQVVAKNYLEVYIYEKWSDKEMPQYEVGQVFRPTEISMVEEATQPPELLTEADLIALMDEHGIGTDATFAEHVETVKARQYADLIRVVYLMPGKLGIVLVEAYNKMGFQLSKPHLRAELERDLKLICEEKKDPAVVLSEQIAKYRHVYKEATKNMHVICESMTNYLGVMPLQVDLRNLSSVEEPVFKCPSCNCTMSIKQQSGGARKFIGCMAYPGCKNTVWLPEAVEDVEVTDEKCSKCSFPINKLKFTFDLAVFSLYERTHIACIGGCDPAFSRALGISPQAFTRNPLSNIRQNQGNNFGQGLQAAVSAAQPVNEPSRWGSNRPNTGSGDANNRPGRVESTRHPPRNPRSSDMDLTNKQPRPAPNPGISRYISPAENPNTATITTNASATWGEIQPHDQLLCYCNEVARRLQVQKEGANKGRFFFKCARPEETRCRFFEWETSEDSSANAASSSTQWGVPSNATTSSTQWNVPSNTTSTSVNNSNRSYPRNRNSATSTDSGWQSQGGASTSASSEPQCHCNRPALRKTVVKETVNKGRAFYGCYSGAERNCDFFEWADQGVPQSQSQTNRPPAKRPAQMKGGMGNDTKKKRRCGICGREGHTRKTCTQNALD